MTPERGNTLGCSQLGALLGLDPWRGPWDVWAAWHGLVPPTPESDAMRWGKILEPVVVTEYQRATGLPVTWTPTSRHYASGLPLSAQVDARHEHDGALVEVKTTSMDSEEPHPHHVAQVQGQLLCVPDAPYARIVYLVRGQRLLWHEIDRDPEYAERIAAAVRQFFSTLDVEPPHGPKQAEQIHPEPNGEAIDLPGLEDSVTELRRLQAESKALAERIDAIKGNICSAMGPAERATIGKYQASWKLVTKAPYTVHPKPYREFRCK